MDFNPEVCTLLQKIVRDRIEEVESDDLDAWEEEVNISRPWIKEMYG